MTKIFDEKFTNVYSLSKTLRRELKPFPKTKEYLQSSGILSRDIQRDKDYDVIKPLFDQLHDRFIRESLSDVQDIDWQDFIVTYNAFRAKVKSGGLDDKDKKAHQKDIDNRMTALRSQIIGQFAITAEKWKNDPERQESKKEELVPFLKESSYKILTEQGILKVLEKEYNHDEEKLKVIKNFNGFFSYFIGFNQNRENYYSDESKSTAVAYRIVDQNLLTFATNCSFKDQITAIAPYTGITQQELQVLEYDYYNTCLHQDGIDLYNSVLGGQTDEHGVRIADGLNVKINLHNQQHSKSDGFKKIPQLKKLYKQIGSIVAKSIPFTLIQNNNELVDIIDNLIIQADKRHDTISTLLAQLWSNSDIDYNTIWISKSALTNISHRYFASWYMLQEKAAELKIFGYKKNDEDSYKLPAYISLGQLRELLNNIAIPQSDNTDQQQYLFKKHLEIDIQGNSLRNDIVNNREYFLILLQREYNKLLSRDELVIDQEDSQRSYRFVGYQQACEDYRVINSFDKSNKEHRDAIKYVADSALAIIQFFKLFRIDESKLDGKEYDLDRYAQFDEILADYPLTKWYDAIRNYLTKKPFSEEKMKLNFDSSYLMSGWSSDFGTSESLILKKGEKYYIAIVHGKGLKKDEKQNLLNEVNDKNGIEKMVLNVQKPDNKNTPRLFIRSKGDNYAPAVIELGLPIDEVIDIYDKKLFSPSKHDPKIHLPFLRKLIDYFKLGFSKHLSYSNFVFQWKDSDQYYNIAQFYDDVVKSCYILDWEIINFDKLIEFVDNGKIYLFELYSKDFGEKAIGSKNLQTVYWNSVFNKGSNIKLLGGAEVFRRNKSITKEKKILHKDNFDVYHNNRYTEDKILFHVPITLGFGSKGGSRFNETFNKEMLIPHHQDMHVIGIDRGEKHLAFYSVISVQTGKIVEQGSLNYVGQDADGNPIDYGARLLQKAETRLAARQNWDVIGNIKNLKDGYISQVVKKITDLILQYNAVVVFEDLNGGFKNSRKKIEHSVYQKLELALVKKLNFLASKQVTNMPGSVTNPYQLTPPVNTFGDIKGKQRGVVLYTRANYTSQTDPVTGWRKTIYLKKGTIKNMKEQLVQKLDSLTYDQAKQSYILSYDNRQLWSNVQRRRGSNDKASGKRISKSYDPTQLLNEWCQKYNINKATNIIDQIKHRPEIDLTVDILSTLIWILDLITQIRNTDNYKNDIILSPVEHNGVKFDSRMYLAKAGGKEVTNTVELPTSGDANGAYNIARKGVMMTHRILDNPERPDLLIRDSEWDEFVGG